MRKDIILGKLPDPFLFEDGSRVQNIEDWKKRREEILKSAVETEFGGMPPEPENMWFEALDLHGKKFTNTYRIHCGTKEYPFTFCMMVWRPDVDRRCPAIVTGDMLYDTNLNDEVIAEARRRGFAVVKFNRVELAHDMYNTKRDSGIYPMWPELRFKAISAWAWGYHRVVDVLRQLDYIDPDQIAITGHSRGGKTVLLAGATDERIAYINPNNSGTHGCGCYRFTQIEEPGVFGEDRAEVLKDLVDAAPHWMGEQMADYVGREDELPYDMHFFKALCAPRCFLETNAYADIWGNPRGSYLTYLAAKEVWKLYGCEENCRTWYRLGGHNHGWADFCALFDFMDAMRCGAPLTDDFTRVPYSDLEPLHDWKCPGMCASMTKEEMMKKLKVSALSDNWAALFEKAECSCEETIGKLTDEAHLKAIMEEYDLFGDYREEILAAAREIRKDRVLALRSCLIHYALEKDETYAAGETELPMGASLGQRLYALIPVINRIPEIAGRYRAHGLPEEYVHDALTEYQGCLYVYSLHNGCIGFDKRFYGWTLLVIRNRLFKVGRLNFEIRKFGGGIRAFRHADGHIVALADGMRIHRSGQVLGSAGCLDEEGSFDAMLTETEEDWIGYPADSMGRIENHLAMLNKAEWTLVLQPGDDILSVHIPRTGALTVENCEAAYRKAWDMLKECYPECDFKAFACSSWMMDRQLGLMLKPGSNIASFQNKYIPFPNKSGGRAVFTFVFQFPGGTDLNALDYEQLPAKTSLQKAIQEKYLKGESIYENGGFFLMD